MYKSGFNTVFNSYRLRNLCSIFSNKYNNFYNVFLPKVSQSNMSTSPSQYALAALKTKGIEKSVW